MTNSTHTNSYNKVLLIYAPTSTTKNPMPKLRRHSSAKYCWNSATHSYFSM